MIKTLCATLLLIVGLVAGPLQAGSVDINTADTQTLADSLTGVGPKLAAAIVAYREQFGPFQSTDDLAKVKGVGAKLLERNRGRFAVGEALDSAHSEPADEAVTSSE